MKMVCAVFLGYRFDVDGLSLVDLLPLDGLHRGLDGLLAEFLRLLGDGACQCSLHHSLQTVIGSVETKDLDVFSGLGTQCLNSAQSHLIVFGIDADNIRIRLHQIAGDVEGFGTIEVGSLFRCDFDVGVLLDLLLEAISAVSRGRGAWSALEDDHLSLLSDGFRQLVRRLGSTCDVVRGDV